MSDGFICYTYNDNAVYGVGASQGAAIDDASTHLLELASDRMYDEMKDAKRGLPTESIVTVPASKALIDEVNRVGGEVAWLMVKGVACLASEAE